ncbi:MAG: magnesium transporter [Chromatiales bacterium]|jgi:magnesium transporter
MEQPNKHQASLQKALAHIQYQLAKQELVSHLVDKSPSAKHDLVQHLVSKQHVTALKRDINQMHPADIAYVLENLPLEQRNLLWSLIHPGYRGSVLIETSDSVRDSLLADMDHAEILRVTRDLDANDIADLAPDLPAGVVPQLLNHLEPASREQLQTALTFPDGSVGALMDFDLVMVREDVSLDVVTRYLRRRGSLPDGMDSLFVVDREGVLRGLLPLKSLLVNNADMLVRDLMLPDPIHFYTNDDANEAAGAFERYDLIIAAVVNVHNQLVGMLKVDAVLDHLQESSSKDLLSQVGLKEEEDLFAPVWNSARNRGLWLALNLLTAFIASRVIDQFEATIAQIVALAALMPVVAAVGGNTGNQTLALVIRGYALDQINESSFMRLLSKETIIGLINGIVWGSTMGLMTWLLYGDGGLALIMLVAMVLTLSFASLAGVYTPTLLRRMGQDPAYGSAIIVTGITDSLGFFIFLGLAAMFLR